MDRISKYEGNLDSCVWCDDPMPPCPPDCPACAENCCQRICGLCHSKQQAATEAALAAPWTTTEDEIPF